MNDRVLRKIKTYYHMNGMQKNCSELQPAILVMQIGNVVGTTANESLKSAKFREKPCTQLHQK